MIAVLARRVHPAEIEPVDADAPRHQREGGVLGQRRERALRDAVGREERLAAMRRHRLDVDHRACDLLAPHDGGGILQQEERRAQVDRHHALEQFGRGVEHRAAVGDAGGVDQRVDAAERPCRPPPSRRASAPRSARSASTYSTRQPPLPRSRRDRLAVPGVAAADHDALRAALGEQPRDRFAEPLRSAGDDGDLAVELLCCAHCVSCPDPFW